MIKCEKRKDEYGVIEKTIGQQRESTLTEQEKEYWMHEAMKEAKKAEEKAEVPIGAIVVYEGKIIGRGHNLRESSCDATTHAEIEAIKQACAYKKNWRLEGCQLFVTLEPCPMCSGAIIQSRIPEVYFGAYDLKGGTCGTLMNLVTDPRFNHQSYVEGNVCHDECQSQLQQFFKSLRKRKKEERLNQKEK